MGLLMPAGTGRMVVMMVSTAGKVIAVMLGMYVLTTHAFEESHDETPAAALAGMHIEAYDTQGVAQDDKQ